MKIIFHHPLPLDPNAKSASGIRPQRMLQAFKELGYEVELVTGYAAERKAAIKRIKEQVKRGAKFDFVYAESSTMPTSMTDKHHLPLHPFLDFGFFRFCNRNSIPVGLFYRDIYWRFEEYGKNLNPLKKYAAKLAYWFDLWVYQRTLTKLYLPSMQMGEYVPLVSKDKFEALPPGHLNNAVIESSVTNHKLSLFYVGGMSNHYQLHVLFEVIREVPDIQFTLCTREAEWQAVKHEYPELSDNIHIIHKTGAAMEEHLKAADIAVLFVKPQEYREFASPVKLYEYLGFHKPVLASAGTLSGQFVQENGVGWAVKYDAQALKELLQQLLNQPELAVKMQAQLKEAVPQHSWQARAKQVIQSLNPEGLI